MRTTLYALSLLILTVSLSGCQSLGWFTDEDEPDTTIYLNAKAPDPVDLEGSDWYTVTPENVEEKFERLRRKGTDEAFMCVDDTGFNNLATDMEKIQAYIVNLKAQLQAYKDFYEGEQEGSKEP